MIRIGYASLLRQAPREHGLLFPSDLYLHSFLLLTSETMNLPFMSESGLLQGHTANTHASGAPTLPSLVCDVCVAWTSVDYVP